MKAIRMAKLVQALLMLGIFAGPALAQEAVEDEGKTSLLTTYLTAGGTIGFIIILFSVVSLALIIEHIVNIKRDKIVPPQLIDEIAIEWHLAKVGPKKASARREEMNLLVRDLKAAGAKARDWQLCISVRRSRMC